MNPRIRECTNHLLHMRVNWFPWCTWCPSQTCQTGKLECRVALIQWCQIISLCKYQSIPPRAPRSPPVQGHNINTYQQISNSSTSTLPRLYSPCPGSPENSSHQSGLGTCRSPAMGRQDILSSPIRQWPRPFAATRSLGTYVGHTEALTMTWPRSCCSPAWGIIRSANLRTWQMWMLWWWSWYYYSSPSASFFSSPATASSLLLFYCFLILSLIFHKLHHHLRLHLHLPLMIISNIAFAITLAHCWLDSVSLGFPTAGPNTREMSGILAAERREGQAARNPGGRCHFQCIHAARKKKPGPPGPPGAPFWSYFASTN